MRSLQSFVAEERKPSLQTSFSDGMSYLSAIWYIWTSKSMVEPSSRLSSHISYLRLYMKLIIASTQRGLSSSSRTMLSTVSLLIGLGRQLITVSGNNKGCACG